MSKLIKPKRGFTIVGNDILLNKEVSLKAIGMYVRLLNYPDHWGFSVLKLTSISKESKNTINKTLQELETHGYLRRKNVTEKGKIVGIDYELYEEPYPKNEDIEKPYPKNEDPQNEDPQNKDNNNKVTKDKVTKDKVNTTTKINNNNETSSILERIAGSSNEKEVEVLIDQLLEVE